MVLNANMNMVFQYNEPFYHNRAANYLCHSASKAARDFYLHYSHATWTLHHHTSKAVKG